MQIYDRKSILPVGDHILTDDDAVIGYAVAFCHTSGKTVAVLPKNGEMKKSYVISRRDIVYGSDTVTVRVYGNSEKALEEVLKARY